jgi:hypothetical protein
MIVILFNNALSLFTNAIRVMAGIATVLVQSAAVIPLTY